MIAALSATLWWTATLYLGLSEAAEVAAITGFFGMVSSALAAWFGYLSHKMARSAHRIEVTEEHGPVMRGPEPGLEKELKELENGE